MLRCQSHGYGCQEGQHDDIWRGCSRYNHRGRRRRRCRRKRQRDDIVAYLGQSGRWCATHRARQPCKVPHRFRARIDQTQRAPFRRPGRGHFDIRGQQALAKLVRIG
ncbi:hypothetical protein H310_01993 [Aphanomyces invadans]|uniref:Uncharacterized protein n=1 Tax=Aphanomyces invadans TaxID=157072 RepID=A0A024UMU7_9STRA|nr:hypothetical protein H310_01993 [Aphanomyces invadans]ETW07485.1 hypothetical protein H310_01993 [Aphanomyces invadans]|eukprot:XP_008863578.1 hypothetical protein H310_01993 [Aphanomyces invadans]